MTQAGHHRRVTLQDIADKAQCSRNTASLALRDSPRISPVMRKKIHAIADKMGYVPNLAARNLITRRSGMIGVYVRQIRDAVRMELVESLLRELHSPDYRPVLGVGNQQVQWSASPWMGTFREMQVEALVIVCEADATLPTWASRIPTVLVGNDPIGSLRCDSVAIDRYEAGVMGIEHLASRGHKRIIVACPGYADGFSKGCVDSIRKMGLHAVTLHSETPRSSLVRVTADMVCSNRSAKNRATAAIFGDSPQAAHFLHEMHTRGVRCPDEIAVVGYDFFPWAHMLKVSLTTIEQPIYELASAAGETIKQRLASPKDSPRQRILPHCLVIRDSG